MSKLSTYLTIGMNLAQILSTVVQLSGQSSLPEVIEKIKEKFGDFNDEVEEAITSTYKAAKAQLEKLGDDDDTDDTTK